MTIFVHERRGQQEEPAVDRPVGHLEQGLLFGHEAELSHARIRRKKFGDFGQSPAGLEFARRILARFDIFKTVVRVWSYTQP